MTLGHFQRGTKKGRVIGGHKRRVETALPARGPVDLLARKGVRREATASMAQGGPLGEKGMEARA